MLMVRPVRGTNPIQWVLGLAGLRNIAKDVTHLFHPANKFHVDPTKLHYFHNGKEWVATNVTLTRTDAKIDTIGGSLQSVAAGTIGKNGRIEPATVVRNFPNTSTTGWTKTGCTVTDYASGGPDGGPYSRCEIPAGQGIYKATSGYANSTPLRPSIYVRRISGTGLMRLSNMKGYLLGQLNISFASLPVNAWVRIDRDSPYVYADYEHVSKSDGTAGLYVVTVSGGPNVLDIAYGCETESQAITTSPVATTSGVVTRAADVWRVTGLSGLESSGGFLALLRFPASSTKPASDAYHLGLNGSDSLDNGVFLYTKASDDCLYAELRSGGVSQGVVNLGMYTHDQKIAVSVTWDETGIRGSINGVLKTASAAVTVPASIDRLCIGRGISSDAAVGVETPLFMLFNRALLNAELTGLSNTANNIPINTYIIVGVGDSIMARNEPVYGQSMLSMLRSRDSRFEKFYNAGVGGAATASIAANFAADAVARSPRFALIEGGTNDLLGVVTQAQYLANISNMMDQCVAAGIIPIVCQVPPAQLFTTAQAQKRDAWKAALAALIAASYPTAKLVDFDTSIGQFRVGGDPGNLWDLQAVYNADDCHPTLAGSKAMADCIYTALAVPAASPVLWPSGV